MIAEDTGGGYFEMNRAENLASTFANVADELHHQYALGFEPPKLDDRMHKVEVKIGKPGMKARVRKEYFAAEREEQAAVRGEPSILLLMRRGVRLARQIRPDGVEQAGGFHPCESDYVSSCWPR